MPTILTSDVIFFQITPLNHSELLKIENNAKELSKKNITLCNLGVEFILRSFSKEKAKEIFPQHQEYLYKTKSSNYQTDILVKEILNSINESKYILERNLRNKKQLKKSMNEILDSYDLKRVSLNKNLKENLGISCKGYPFIICRNDILEQGEDGKWRICSQNIQI